MFFCVFFNRSTKSHNDIDADGDLSDSVPDEAFYYQEIEVEGDLNTNNSPNPPSPPTLSHRDMARPPHEDPEYQKQLVGDIRFVELFNSFSQNQIYIHWDSSSWPFRAPINNGTANLINISICECMNVIYSFYKSNGYFTLNRYRRQGLLALSQTPVKPPLPVVAGPINIPTSPLAHHNYTWAQQSSVSQI